MAFKVNITSKSRYKIRSAWEKVNIWSNSAWTCMNQQEVQISSWWYQWTWGDTTSHNASNGRISWDIMGHTTKDVILISLGASQAIGWPPISGHGIVEKMMKPWDKQTPDAAWGEGGGCHHTFSRSQESCEGSRSSVPFSKGYRWCKQMGLVFFLIFKNATYYMWGFLNWGYPKMVGL